MIYVIISYLMFFSTEKYINPIKSDIKDIGRAMFSNDAKKYGKYSP